MVLTVPVWTISVDNGEGSHPLLMRSVSSDLLSNVNVTGGGDAVQPCRPTRFDRLPTLTRWDATDSPLQRWHAYYRSVYRQDVESVIDLNLFSFFYWASPLGRPRLAPIHWEVTPTAPNMPWTCPWPGSPELVVNQRGYFVWREPRPELFRPGRMLEVFRVDIEQNNSVTGDAESAVCWFYHTVGSGIFIRIPPRSLVVNSRDDVARVSNGTAPWPSLGADGDAEVASMLKELGVDMLVVLNSPRGQRISARTEILVARPPGGAGTARTCCKPLEVFAGPDGTHAAQCEDSSPTINAAA